MCGGALSETFTQESKQTREKKEAQAVMCRLVREFVEEKKAAFLEDCADPEKGGGVADSDGRDLMYTLIKSNTDPDLMPCQRMSDGEVYSRAQF